MILSFNTLRCIKLRTYQKEALRNTRPKVKNQQTTDVILLSHRRRERAPTSSSNLTWSLSNIFFISLLLLEKGLTTAMISCMGARMVIGLLMRKCSGLFKESCRDLSIHFGFTLHQASYLLILARGIAGCHSVIYLCFPAQENSIVATFLDYNRFKADQ